MRGRFERVANGNADTAVFQAHAHTTSLPHQPPAPAEQMPASRLARKAVAHAWARVLDRRSLRADLAFDEAGGDSLRLIRLIFELEIQCGMNLKLDAFTSDLRPSEMARALDRCLRGLADDIPDEAPEVFLLPAVGGDDPRLVKFRAGCRSALRIELVDLGDWSELIEPTFDLPALVSNVAAWIMDRAPSGPLRLVGWSYGGHLAMLVAAALCQAGREVAFLGILDTLSSPMSLADLAPQPQPTRMENLRHVPAWIRRGELRTRLADFIVARVVVRPRLLRQAARLRHMWLPFGFSFYLNLRMGLRLRRDMLSAWRRRLEPPPPLPVASIVLFRAEDSEPAVPDAVGWRAAYPGISVVEISGGHWTMLDPPNLAPLCQRFTAAVLRASPGSL